MHELIRSGASWIDWFIQQSEAPVYGRVPAAEARMDSAREELAVAEKDLTAAREDYAKSVVTTRERLIRSVARYRTTEKEKEEAEALVVTAKQDLHTAVRARQQGSSSSNTSSLT